MPKLSELRKLHRKKATKKGKKKSIPIKKPTEKQINYARSLSKQVHGLTGHTKAELKKMSRSEVSKLIDRMKRQEKKHQTPTRRPKTAVKRKVKRKPIKKKTPAEYKADVAKLKAMSPEERKKSRESSRVRSEKEYEKSMRHIKKRGPPKVRKAPTERQVDYAMSLMRKAGGQERASIGAYTEVELRKMSRFEVSSIIERYKY